MYHRSCSQKNDILGKYISRWGYVEQGIQLISHNWTSIS